MGKDKEYFEKIAEYGQLIVISGPSGVGKRTIIKEYMKQHESAVKCVSVTTRAQRPEEVEGREHYFVSQLEFERMVRSQSMSIIIGMDTELREKRWKSSESRGRM